MKRVFSVTFLMVIALFIGTGAHAADKTINGAGASFPYPVYSAWAIDYNKVTGIKLNYQSIGSGGGQRQIVNRTVDFGASDDPLTPEELAKDKLLQFPAVIGGVVPVVNVQGIKTGEVRMDADALCRIFLGDITNWSNDAIKKLNPKLTLPNAPITVTHRSDGSGTTAIFTNYLASNCPNFKSRVGEGKAVKWPVGIGGKGNEGVANYVKRTANSIGYVEFAYAKQNNLSWVQLKNAAGTFVEPTFDTFKSAADSGNFDPKKDFYLWLTNAPGKNAWPIAGATFILLAKEKDESNSGTAKFFAWAFKNGDKTATNLIYVPLPDSLKKKVMDYWKGNGIVY